MLTKLFSQIPTWQIQMNLSCSSIHEKNLFGTLAYYCRQNQMRYSESPLLQLTFFVDMQGEEVSMRDEGQVFVLEGISTKTWLIL